ncbi:MAG TPA: hypothetical protein VGD69_22120 [Herpetosiphonaceae bacterium]
MAAMVILSILLIGLIVFDLAALRWGVDSSDRSPRPSLERQRWRGIHGN